MSMHPCMRFSSVSLKAHSHVNARQKRRVSTCGDVCQFWFLRYATLIDVWCVNGP